MLEKELKAMLTEEAFHKIEAMYKWDSKKLQENHYYVDTDGVLSQNRAVFRIRFKDGEYKIQVKVHKNQGSPLQICEETEFPAECAPESFSAEDGFRYTGLKTGKLVKLGFNTTLRYSFMWNDTTEICLDKTDYFDETDYEIEVEYTEECSDALLAELKAAGVEFTEKSVGKYTRFMKKFYSLSQK